MNVLFSRRCQYALQAVLYVAARPEGDMITIKELTERLEIPYHFLAKILQDLSRKKLLVSHKGPRGGFALGMKASEITLFHIIEAIDGLGLTGKCVLGFPNCSETNQCALHSKWSALRESIYSMLVSRNIEQLAREMGKQAYRIE
jgi:Rrf2 family protein